MNDIATIKDDAHAPFGEAHLSLLLKTPLATSQNFS